MNNTSFSIREALRVGWQKTLANFWPLCFILLVTWVVSGLTSGFSGRVENDALGVLIFILGIVLQLLLQMGTIRVVLKVLDGGRPAVEDFYSTPSQFFQFLGAAILCGLAVFAGFILLIIPGIILAIRLQFYPYLVLERNARPMESLKRSWAMTKGQTGKLFVFGLVAGLVGFAGILLLGVGLFLTIPLVTIAAGYVYRKLSAADPAASASSATVTPAAPTGIPGAA